jgi:hypothetical protein
MDPLKLIGFDAEDLGVISAHLQDAILRIEDIAWQPRERRFAAVMNRFDWAQALAADGRTLVRRQTALRFDRVDKVRSAGITLGGPKPIAGRDAEPLVLLTIGFALRRADDPAGKVTLTFAGSATIELEVECLEVELRDLGPAWKARGQPHHPVDDATGPGGKS